MSISILLFLILINDGFLPVVLALLLVLLFHSLRAEHGRVLHVELRDDVEAGALGHREELGQEHEDAAAEHGVLGAGQPAEEVYRGIQRSFVICLIN